MPQPHIAIKSPVQFLELFSPNSVTAIACLGSLWKSISVSGFVAHCRRVVAVVFHHNHTCSRFVRDYLSSDKKTINFDQLPN